MTINNFQHFIDKIKNEEKYNGLKDTEFYYIQIIQRSKDFDKEEYINIYKGKNNTNCCIKSYYVFNSEYLENRMEEMIYLVEYFKARIYIHYTPRDTELIAKLMLQEVPTLFINKHYQAMNHVYDSCCGKTQSYHKERKTWIIDIDNQDYMRVLNISNYIPYSHLRMTEMSTDNHNLVYTDLIQSINQTKNGYHIITKPFDSIMFQQKYPNVEIHKNNPTLLYCP